MPLENCPKPLKKRKLFINGWALDKNHTVKSEAL